MVEPRKPVVTTAGIPSDLARAMEPVKQMLEMLTGRRSGIREIRALQKDATLAEVIERVNEIACRLNGSGDAK